MKTLFAGLCLVLFVSSAHAIPVGDIKIVAKILSYDAKVIRTEVEGRKIELPRRVLKDSKIYSGVTREITLTPRQFTAVRVQFHSKSVNK